MLCRKFELIPIEIEFFTIFKVTPNAMYYTYMWFIEHALCVHVLTCMCMCACTCTCTCMMRVLSP